MSRRGREGDRRPIQTNTYMPVSVRRPPARPPPPRPSQPPAFAPLVASETDTTDNKSQIAFLRAKHKELMDFLQVRYEGDRRTQTLRLNLTQIRMLPEYVSRTAGVAAAGPNTTGYRVASFAYETGVLEVAPRDEGGNLRPKQKLLMSYLHEAGHCLDSFVPLSDDHGVSWRAHVLWLTNIATQDLKWDVLLSCYYCDNYLMCSKSQCPSCGWECPPTGKTPKAPALSKNSIPGFHKYSMDAYRRVCLKEDLAYDWWKGICTDYETKNGLPRRKRLKTAAAEIATAPVAPKPQQAPCICPAIFKPVCHEGKMYSNACLARCGKPGAVTTPALPGANGQFSCPPAPSAKGPSKPTCTCKPVNEPVCAMPREGGLQTIAGTLYTNACLARCDDASRALYPPTRGANGALTCPLPA